jgi:ribosomal protein S9
MQQRALAGAFDMFIGTVGQLKAHRQTVEKAMARWEQAKRIVQRLLHSQLVHAFDSYAYLVSEVRRNRETFRRVVLRMQQRALAGAFDMFIGKVGQLKAHRQTVKKAMGRWRTPAMATVMWAWMEYMEVVAQERKDEALNEVRVQLSGMSEIAKTLQESHGQVIFCTTLYWTCLFVPH